MRPTPSLHLLTPRGLLRPSLLTSKPALINQPSALLRQLPAPLPQQQRVLPPPTPNQTRPLTSLLSSLASSTTSLSAPQTLHAHRTLPYSPSQLYSIIADIDSYRFFLPNCTESKVTHWTSPSPTPPPEQGEPKKWPARADLTVGWGPFTQSYTSLVYCIPGSIVEAVSGQARTTLDSEQLKAAGYDVSDMGRKELVGMEGIFQSLVTRWTVRAGQAPTRGVGDGREWAEVELRVQFRFANPALGFAVGQVAGEKVDEMVQAFEERAKRLYGRREV